MGFFIIFDRQRNIQVSYEQIIQEADLLVLKNCQAISKGSPLANDLRQEVMLVLLELPKERLHNIHENGILGYFINRVVKNQFESVTSPFYKKFREKAAIEYNGQEDSKSITSSGTYNPEIDQKAQEIRDILKKMGTTETLLIKYYIQEGSLHKVSKITGIPYTNLRRYFVWVKEQVKQNLNVSS